MDDYFQQLENKASPVTHQLESQGQLISASLKSKKAQSLTPWRAKDNHLSRLENKASPVTYNLESQRQPSQQA